MKQHALDTTCTEGCSFTDKGKHMKEVAHVFWDGGSVWLPTDTPYANEVLADYVRRAARGHGHVRLHMNHHECALSAGPLAGMQCTCMTPTRCWLPPGLARRLECGHRRLSAADARQPTDAAGCSGAEVLRL